MTRAPEMCVEASLAQQARQDWECQTPSHSVSLHMLFQSTIFRMIRDRKNVRDWAGLKRIGESVWMCMCVYMGMRRGQSK